jgi:hypothetical protein
MSIKTKQIFNKFNLFSISAIILISSFFACGVGGDDPLASEVDANGTILWVSMREAVIELNASDIGAEMGVIVSLEENTPDYDSVKDLPGFYTRVSKDENRTVYLSMTDKMTSSMVSVGKYIGLDGTKAGFDPLTNAPEIMHPNTKYYAHIYSAQGGLNSSATTTKIEFTTKSYPTAFPTANEAGKDGATWSSVYSHGSDAVIEYKIDEAYLMPIRMFYYNPPREKPLAFIYKDLSSNETTIDYTSPDKDITVVGGYLGNMLVYNLYKIPSSPALPLVDTDKNPIWDMMFYHTAKSRFYGQPFLEMKLDYTFGLKDFFFINDNTFKSRLVNE